jgi:hypothetical protein
LDLKKHIHEQVNKFLNITEDNIEDNSEDLKSNLPTMAFVSNIYSTDVVHEVFNDMEDVRSLFKELYKKEYKSKNGNMLMSGAKFTTESENTIRGNENITNMSFITFDFDNTQLTPEEVFEVLKVKFLAYNTYSNSQHKKCWRLLIPLLFPIPKEIYEYLWMAIKRRFEHMFPRKKLGIDESKKTPNSLFYVPCQAADKKYSFFYEEGWNFNTLNPYRWFGAFDFTEESERKIPVSKRSDEMQKLAEAIMEKDKNNIHSVEYNLENARNILRSAKTGKGDDAFFRYALRLKKYCGYSLHEIECMLHEDASLTRSPKQRRTQIKSIMHSLASGLYDRLV